MNTPMPIPEPKTPTTAPKDPATTPAVAKDSAKSKGDATPAPATKA